MALREYAPDVILLPGPGSTLGAACAQLVVTAYEAGVITPGWLSDGQR